ncbi:HNH endonuclease [Paracoccus marinaquae]|uniref:Putative HNH nuclease YajD n=1 Tax=Paracoccus marinaquae TaxID=2841926 RepID=A0ABS6AG71_9RHOB|nr:HNH endonuclease signature motif containing protein [Paracoccus marinaquae]MBU3028957.1 HNH endonuclease [Paracoccus marinaquae]
MGLKREYRKHSRRVTSTKRWQVLRQIILERDNWTCACGCGERRRLEIDHIKPVRTHPELAFDPANLQALAPSCHAQKTRIEVGWSPVFDTPEKRAWGQAVADLAAKSNRATHEVNHA